MSDATETDLLGGEVKSPRRKKRLGQKQLEYAKAYGYSLRQIKNWLAKGREIKTPPPLDDPADMPAWFEQAYDRKCPTKLWGAVEELTGESEADVPGDPIHLPELNEGELGIIQTHRRMQEAEARNHRLYLLALEEGNQSKANLYSKEMTRLSTELRHLEKLVQQAREKNRDLIPAVEVRNEVTGMLMALYRQLITGGVKFRDAFAEPLDPETFDARWREKMNGVFSACAISEFAETFELHE